MFNPSQWSSLGGLLFAARRLVEGVFAGQHDSLRQGHGLEFHDYLAYTPGDDLTNVDWKLYGRTDRYYVKRYRQLTDLHAYVMLDCSASMNFAGLDRRGRPVAGDDAMTKLNYAQLLAAAIAFLTVRQVDRVGLGIFGRRLEQHLPAGGTFAHLKQVCASIEQAPTLTEAGAGDIAHSLKQAHAIQKRRGLLVLISDLLDDPTEVLRNLGRFRHDRFDALVLQVLTPQELTLDGLKGLNVTLVDAETRRSVQTDPARVQGRYQQLLRQHVRRLRRGCLAHGIDYELLTTDQPPMKALRRYLMHRRQLKGV